MSNVYSLPLPPLTVNRAFIDEFISANPPCFALGMIEERKKQSGFLAFRPNEAIPTAAATVSVTPCSTMRISR